MQLHPANYLVTTASVKARPRDGVGAGNGRAIREGFACPYRLEPTTSE